MVATKKLVIKIGVIIVNVLFEKHFLFPKPKQVMDWRHVVINLGLVASNALITGACFAGGSRIFSTMAKSFPAMGKVLQIKKPILKI